MEIPISHGPVDRVTEYKFHDYGILTIGRFSYLIGRALIHYYAELSPIRIGNFCSVATNVSFFLRANHRPDWVSTYAVDMIPWPEALPRPAGAHNDRKGDIVIGNDLWIGEGARFLPGVTVGHGAVIGASTVVTKDVPPYALFAGNPGQVRKMRFADSDIEFLLRLNWWDWPTEKVREFAPIICSAELAKLRKLTEG